MLWFYVECPVIALYVKVGPRTFLALAALVRNSEEEKKRQGKRQREHVPHQPSYKHRLQSWHMQTQRVAVFKSFNHTTAQSPMWRCTLHHWKLVLLMLSRVKYGGVVGLGGNCALCSWFKVGWSRNNGHEKNMARLWEAAHFHYFRRHSAQNGPWESGCTV